MSKLEIIKVPNKILRERSKKIKIFSEDIKKIAADLAETVESYQSEAESGVAMAAIQAGIPLKLIVVRDEDGSYLCFANAEIVNQSSKETADLEGCLSVPQVYGMVSRPEKIKIKVLDMNNKVIQIKFEGLMARILQHEIDHTNGILFTNHISDLDKMYTLRKDGKLITKKGEVLEEDETK